VKKLLWLLPIIPLICVSFAPSSDAQTKVKRINRAIELLEQDQTIYYFTEGRGGSQGGYKEGLALAGTWAEMIIYEMEFGAYDVTELREFMAGLVAAGPTPTGHRTPAVQVVLPFGGYDEATVRANHWIVQQVLAAGVHGVTMNHARTPGAVRTFVETARFAHRKGPEPVGEGMRGNGGQLNASRIWGLTPGEYIRKADPWPLNPEGELLLGLKIEDRYALDVSELTAKTPGIGYAEWGPGDMGLSFGIPELHDPPYPKALQDARARVRDACKAAGIAFLDVVKEHNVEDRIREGVRIGAASSKAIADKGRAFSRSR
jgi:4-hydroxy-2-oxoheptanedioate aldolase